MTSATSHTTSPLHLTGEGYHLTVSPEALQKKQTLLHHSGTILFVTSNDDSAHAQRIIRHIVTLRAEVEKSRKHVKEPILKIGKNIDQAAKDYLTQLETEETRLKKLVGDHAFEIERLRKQKQQEEHTAFEAARRARQEAERAAAQAQTAREENHSIAALLAAKQAEKQALTARQDTLTARLKASDDLAATKLAEGVRFVLDFEILDIEKTLHEKPQLVELTLRRAATLTYLKEQEAAGLDPIALGKALGLHVFKKAAIR